MPRRTVSCQPSSVALANFKAWAQGLHDAMLAVGFVQTSDTGQIDFNAITVMPAVNTNVGYAIYELNDSLSGTQPIYVKIEFKTWIATNAKAMPTTQVGRGTDGAGTLTGIFLDYRAMVYYSSSSTSTTSSNILVSRGDGYFAIHFWGGAGSDTTTPYSTTYLAFERARNFDGTYRGDSFFLARGAYANGSSTSAIDLYAMRYSDGANLGNLHPGCIMMPNFLASMGIGGGITPLFFPPLLWAPGVAPWQPTVIAGVPTQDNPGIAFDAEVYGVTRTYYAPGKGANTPHYTTPVYAGTTQQQAGTNASLAILWDA